MWNRCEEKRTEESLARMMREGAGEEGAALLETFSRTQSQPLPGGLDEKCQGLIEKRFSRQRTKDTTGCIMRTLCMTALCLCSLLGIGTVTVLSVESIREPVIQYVVSASEKALEFSGTNLAPQSFVPDTSVDLTDPLGQWLPDDYVISKQSGDSLDFYFALYSDSQGHMIVLSSHSLHSEVVWDTEGAQIFEEMTFCGHRAFLIVEDSKVSFVWVDEQLGISIGITANDCSAEEVMDLAEQLITELKE